MRDFFRGRGAGEDGLRTAGEDDFGRGEHGRENFAHFAFAAAGQEREEIRIARFVAENFQLRRHGVSDKIGVETGFFVEIFFEGKDAEHAVEPASHAGNTGAVPSPDLRTYVVEEFQARAVRLQSFGHAEVEAGVVDKQDGIGFVSGDAIEGFAKLSAEPSVAAEHVPEADNGGIVRPVIDVGAHGVELGSAQARDLQIRTNGF